MASDKFYYPANNHIYPIIDLMVEESAQELAADGRTISCKKGCSHCCYLLVEITWEEALELAYWVKQQPKEEQQSIFERIEDNAQNAKELFNTMRRGKRFAEPVEGQYNIPEKLFDEYFYKLKQPCPFLKEGICGAYSHRPSPCRFHFVTSPSQSCSADPQYIEEEVDVPEEFEAVKDSFSPILNALHRDPRWGHLAIMVKAALEELDVLP